jgi:hypothetical protein
MTFRLRVIHAIVVLWIIAPAARLAAAEIRADKSQLYVSTGSLEVIFQGGAIASIKNVATGEQYVKLPAPQWLQMKILDFGDVLPQPASGWQIVTDAGFGAAAVLPFSGSAGVRITMRIGVDPATDEIAVRLEGEATQPGVVSILWGIQGLSLSPGRLVIPAQAGTYYDAISTPSLIGLDYPVHWEHQFVVYESTAGGFWVYANEPKPAYKRLHASRQTGNLDMALEYFATAPWNEATRVAQHEWRFSGFAGNWRVPAGIYKERLNSIRPNAPADGTKAWVKDIRGVVTLQTRELAVLDILTAKLNPQQTLLHLVDWRRDAFDINYPDYRPGDGTEPFVRRAHELGFHVMVHVNVVGVSETNPNFAAMQPYQLKTADELHPMGWLWDDLPEGDPGRIAYINPAYSPYRRLLVESIRPAIEGLHIDVLHLDAGGAIVNDGNGLIEGMNTIEGIMQIHKDLMDAFPDLVLGDESTNEITGPFIHFAQRWTSDSPPHPISTFLLGDQVQFYGFLDQPIADEPHYTDFLKRYEGQGILPTVQVTNIRDLDPDRVRQQQLLRQIRLWQEDRFNPVWETPWDGRLFVERGENGQVAQIEADEHSVRLKVDDQILYERIRNADRWATSQWVQYWPAYDDNFLYGLDPTVQYWLEPEWYRPSGLPHLLELPRLVTVGYDTLATPDYALFDLATPDPSSFDFISSFGIARQGTIWNGKDWPIMLGATAAVTRIVIDKQLQNQVLVMQPPYRRYIGGAVYVEYTVSVPDAPGVRFSFKAGLPDRATRSDGVFLVIRIDGEEQWRANLAPVGLHPFSIDITKYAGRTVTFRLITHPGIHGNAILDWACWTDLQITTDVSRPQTAIPVALGGDGLIAAVSDTARLDSVDGKTVQVTMDLPGKFVLFSTPPQPVTTGSSLLDFKFDVWRAGYDGLAYQNSYEYSGTITGAASAGELREKTLTARPPRNGFTIITFPVQLPQDASQLQFGAGLADPPPDYDQNLNYSGVNMIFLINGEKLWEKELRTAGWTDVSIDLGRWAGKPVLVELVVDSLNNAAFDWAQWSDLTVN